jgi:hypothetical protein
MCTRPKLRCFPARSQALDSAVIAVIATTVDDCRVALRHLAVSLRMSAMVALSAFLYERNILISPCGM